MNNAALDSRTALFIMDSLFIKKYIISIVELLGHMYTHQYGGFSCSTSSPTLKIPVTSILALG